MAALLRTLRQEANLRQVDVANALDVPQRYVSKYESGERRLDLVELGAVAEALDIPLLVIAERFGV